MKSFLFFLLGAAVGFTAAYFGLKGHMEAQQEAELEDIQKYYEAKLCKQSGDKRSGNPQKAKKDPETEAAIQKTEEIIRYNRYSSTGSLTKIAETVLDPLNGSTGGAAKAAEADADRCEGAPFDEDEEDEEEYPLPDDSPYEKVPDPYFITMDEFGELSGYEMETLYFYEENEVLLDDADCFIDNADRILGDDPFSSFDENDRAYIRNERNMTDYEIICYHSAYEE